MPRHWHPVEEGATIVIDNKAACTMRATGAGSENLHGVKYVNRQTIDMLEELTLEVGVHEAHPAGLAAIEATGTGIYERKPRAALTRS